MKVLPSVDNVISAPVVAVASPNAPITTGVVNFYLVALTGTNAGKWFDGSEWQASESVVATGTHMGHGHWSATIGSGAWVSGTQYRLYVSESNSLSIVWGMDLFCEAISPTATQIDTELTSNHGSGSWQQSTDAGSGTYTVTITVTDGSVAVENVAVRVTKGAETHRVTTNSSGQAVFNLDNGTWVIAATLPYYTFSGDTVEVSGDTSKSIAMTATSIPAASIPTQTVAYGLTVDASGDPESGVVVTITLVQPPNDAAQYSRVALTATSAANGTYNIELLKSAVYTIGRTGTSKVRQFTTGTGETYELPVL